LKLHRDRHHLKGRPVLVLHKISEELIRGRVIELIGGVGDARAIGDEIFKGRAALDLWDTDADQFHAVLHGDAFHARRNTMGGVLAAKKPCA